MFFPPNVTAATDNPAVDFLINFINTLDPNRSAASPLLGSLLWPKWDSACVEGPSSLLTFADGGVIDVTADDFRSDAISYLVDLHLKEVTVPGPRTPADIPDDEAVQPYLGHRTEL
ncbi:hypothetical protein DFH06DRAFT_1400262 [Mycena polygramma]|nr:hypothetical protein DFH06DRAFT_1400262 [Mycena polygramma]